MLLGRVQVFPGKTGSGAIPDQGSLRKRFFSPRASDAGSRTAPQIAKAIGIDPEADEAHLRRTLSAMRKAGLLGGDSRKTGYPLTEAGRAALEKVTE